MGKEEAVKTLKAHYKGKPFLPKSFSDENHIQEIKGIYVPFWLFDGQAEADVRFTATRSSVMVTGAGADHHHPVFRRPAGRHGEV